MGSIHEYGRVFPPSAEEVRLMTQPSKLSLGSISNAPRAVPATADTEGKEGSTQPRLAEPLEQTTDASVPQLTSHVGGAGVAAVVAAPVLLLGSVHAASLGPFLRWVPYPTQEQVLAFRWAEPAFVPYTAGWAVYCQRLFFGNLWTGCNGPHTVNFLIDALVNCPMTGVLRGPRVAVWEQHSRIVTAETGERKKWDTGCGHGTVAFDAAVSVPVVVAALHKRVLFDLTGLWYADTPEQMEHLRVYTRSVWQMDQRARHEFLRTLPCTALTVEPAQTASRVRGPRMC